MTQREEAIGRAAWDAKTEKQRETRQVNAHCAEVWWHNEPPKSKNEIIAMSLAAVSAAREIDTCNTCSWQTWDENVGWICSSHRFRCDQIGFEGCNRHEPKGE